MRKVSKRLLAGFNLIEIAIVLGIIGIVLGGIWAATRGVSDSRQVDDTLRDVASICSRGTNVFPVTMAPATGAADSWGDDVTEAAISARVIPPTAANGTDGLMFAASTSPSKLLWYRQNKTLASSNVGGRLNITMIVKQGGCASILSKLPAASNSKIAWVSLRGSASDLAYSDWSGLPSFFETDFPTTQNLYQQCTGYPFFLLSIVC